MPDFGCLSKFSFYFETMKKRMGNKSMVDLFISLLAILLQNKSNTPI